MCAMSWGPMRYSVTVIDVSSLLESGVASVLVRSARVVMGIGVSVIRSGNRANRHSGDGVQMFLKLMLGRGGHGIVIGVMVFSGMYTRGPLIETKSDLALRPRLYSSCAAGGLVGWRYQASSNIA